MCGDPVAYVALRVEEGASEDGFAVDICYRNVADERLYGSCQSCDRYAYKTEVELTEPGPAGEATRLETRRSRLPKVSRTIRRRWSRFRVSGSSERLRRSASLLNPFRGRTPPTDSCPSTEASRPSDSSDSALLNSLSWLFQGWQISFRRLASVVVGAVDVEFWVA